MVHCGVKPATEPAALPSHGRRKRERQSTAHSRFWRRRRTRQPRALGRESGGWRGVSTSAGSTATPPSPGGPSPARAAAPKRPVPGRALPIPPRGVRLGAAGPPDLRCSGHKSGEARSSFSKLSSEASRSAPATERGWEEDGRETPRGSGAPARPSRLTVRGSRHGARLTWLPAAERERQANPAPEPHVPLSRRPRAELGRAGPGRGSRRAARPPPPIRGPAQGAGAVRGVAEAAAGGDWPRAARGRCQTRGGGRRRGPRSSDPRAAWRRRHAERGAGGAAWRSGWGGRPRPAAAPAARGTQGGRGSPGPGDPAGVSALGGEQPKGGRGEVPPDPPWGGLCFPPSSCRGEPVPPGSPQSPRPSLPRWWVPVPRSGAGGRGREVQESPGQRRRFPPGASLGSAVLRLFPPPRLEPRWVRVGPVEQTWALPPCSTGGTEKSSMSDLSDFGAERWPPATSRFSWWLWTGPMASVCDRVRIWFPSDSIEQL